MFGFAAGSRWRSLILAARSAASRASASVRLDVVVFHHLRPSRELARNLLAEFFRRTTHHAQSRVFETLEYPRVLNRCVESAVERLDDGRRRTSRYLKSEPRLDDESFEAGFDHR